MKKVKLFFDVSRNSFYLENEFPMLRVVMALLKN